MKKTALSVGLPEYTLNSDETAFASAKLALNFSHDTKGIEYSYVLNETISPIGDGHDYVSTSVTNTYPFTYAELAAYTVDIDLPQSDRGRPGRGIYSYTVDVYPEGANSIERVFSDATRTVSEFINQPAVDNFKVEDGYPDKYVISWTRFDNIKYVLEYSETEGGSRTKIEEFFNYKDSDGEIYRYEYDDQESGISRFFYMTPWTNNTDSPNTKGPEAVSGEKQTLGTAVVSVQADSLSYKDISIEWAAVKKADAYRIHYGYGNVTDEETEIIAAGAIPIDGISGKYRMDFAPEGYNDVTMAGKDISLTVEALNTALTNVSTNSAPITAKVLGPAPLETSVTQAASVSDIQLSWNEIPGAAGYYIIRRQFDMDNTNRLSDSTYDEALYYVDSSGNVTGKGIALVGGIREDSDNVPITINRASGRYTLIDEALEDAEYDSYEDTYLESYRNEQNDMLWGYPYRYTIIPVLSEDDVPEFSDTGIETTYTVASVEYTGISREFELEQTGFALGFAADVTATKGTYAGETETIDGETRSVNTGIKVTWKAPSQLPSSVNPTYRVYRKAETDDTWPTDPIDTAPPEPNGINSNEFFVVDNSAEEGKAYDYLVGVTASNIVGSSSPHRNKRFIESRMDVKVTDEDSAEEHSAPERAMTGFILAKPKLSPVSRTQNGDEASGYYEAMSWGAAGVPISTSSSKHRGIAGYEIQVMNRNIDGLWHTIKDVPIKTPAEAAITPLNQNVYNTDDNLLKVLRDYKHYFRIRAYANGEEGKVYSAASEYDWADSKEDDYVKWGARQITAEEFAAITSLAMGTALSNRDGYSVSLDESNVGYNRAISFNNSQPIYLTINGTLYGYCTATGRTPTAYGADCAGIWGALSGGTDHESTLTITSIFELYSGTVKIKSLYDNAGQYTVIFNGKTKNIDNKHVTKPFTFNAGSNNYKNCDSLDWDLATGWK
jgi:hypothetical protein